MPKILKTPPEAIRAAERAALETARGHIDAARALYEQSRWPQACFLAMTAIEEQGKALLLQHADATDGQLDLRELRDHDPKAILGSVATLIFNDEARARYGANPVTGLPRIEAIRYVAEGGEWMALRNACLYVDCDPRARTVAQPSEEITREYAYLMIVGALEILARIYSPGFTYHAIPMDADLDDARERAVLAELAAFQEWERGAVDLDRLDIISNPERVQQLREAVRAARSTGRDNIEGTVYGLPFVVGNEPFYLWDWDMRDRNLTFLNSVDPTYFEYLVRVHGAGLKEDPQHAAIALRTGYHHALESFFALLFAALQAPACVFAWLQKYKIGQVRALVESVNLSQPIRNKLGLKPPTWETISERINLFRYDDSEKLAETRRLFAVLWRRFAGDFLNENHSNEYNSVKHGFRARAGGFGLAVGLETVPGEAAPPESMQPLGASEFGTSYFVAEPIPKSDRKTHFRVRRHALNWLPEAMAAGLQLVGVSINNVVACLKIMNGVSPKDVQFNRPEDPAFFDEPWRHSVGVMHMTLDRVFSEEHVRLVSKDELLALYDRPDQGSEAEAQPSSG